MYQKGKKKQQQQSVRCGRKKDENVLKRKRKPAKREIWMLG